MLSRWYRWYNVTFFISCFFCLDVGFEPLAEAFETSSTSSADSGEPFEIDAELQIEEPEVPEMTLTVTGKKRLIRSSGATSRSELRREDISLLSQGGEVSLSKLIATTTPGVVPGPMGQLFFRGNHGNFQYQIDGVQLPDSPSGTFGQIMSARNIERMEVVTGGIPAEYGQRLSAILDIVTRSGPEKPSGEIELNYGSYNTVSPHLLFGGSNELGNFRYFLSANYNQTDRGIDTPQPVSEADQTQGGTDSIHNFSNGTSEFLRLDWLLDHQDKVSLFAYFNQNNFQIPNYPASFKPSSPFFGTGFTDSFGNQNPDGPTYLYRPSDTNDSQSQADVFGQVVWKHGFSERAFLTLAPYYKYSRIIVTNDPANDLMAKTLGTPGADPVSFAQDRTVNNAGLKGDYSYRLPILNDQHWVKTGFQLQGSRSAGPVTIETQLGSPVTDNSPTNGFSESVYIQDEYTISKFWILNAGVRYDAVQFSFSGQNSEDSLVQPRVGLRYLPWESTQFHVFYGKLFQPAPVENLRFQFNANGVAVNTLLPYDIKAEKDDYFEAGVSQQIGNHQLVSLNAFYKTGINILDDTQLLNTSIAQAYNFATGFAYGVELSLRGQLSPEWSEYANYSYQIAKGKGISGGIWTGVIPSNNYQILDHVQEHSANAGVTYSKNGLWWTTQLLFGSGLRTGPENSISLPLHLTFDTTVGYEFRGKEWWNQFKVSGDVLNIFDDVYPITISNGYNGSHYAAGRQFFVRVSKEI